MSLGTETPDPEVLSLITGHFEERPDYHSFRPRGSASWLLIVTLSGSGIFKSEQEYIAKAGDWVLIKPRSPHDYRTYEDRWELLWCHFHPRPHWLPWLRWSEWSRGGFVESPERSSEIIPFMFSCHRYSSQNSIHSDSLAMNALEAAILLVDQARRTKARALDPRIVEALEIVATRLDQPFSLENLAERVGLSSSRFSHLFTIEVGVSPREFIEGLRLDRASGLLKLTSLSIQEIASRVGFENPFYFALRFRKRTGKSPTQYRLDFRD